MTLNNPKPTFRMLTIFNPRMQEISDLYVNEVYVPTRKAYNPRAYLPKVRDGWTKPKIKRYMRPSEHGIFTAAKFISEYDSPEDLKNHMFYHGTSYGTSKGMLPSIKQPSRDVERYGGGGYGQQYWGISLTPNKRIASRFSHPTAHHVAIYPVLLAKNAVVEDAPEMTDAADIEDVIEDFWNRGVDAVRLGDWKSGNSEEELLVLNPAAICNTGQGDFYKVFQLGLESNPIHYSTDDDIAKVYEFAKEYVSAERPVRPPPKPAWSYYSSVNGDMMYRRRSDSSDIGEPIDSEEYGRLMDEYERKMEEYRSRNDVVRYEAMEDKLRRLLSL